MRKTLRQPLLLFIPLWGCSGSDLTDIPGVAEVIGVTSAGSEGPAGEVTDVCCFPGEVGEKRSDQCEDSLVLESICEHESRCCEDSWYPQCASAYATYASSCATLVESGGGSASGAGGGGSYTPSAEVLAAHAPIDVQLVVELEPDTSLESGGTLFLAGFAEVESHTGRPGRGAQPDHYAQFPPSVEGWPRTSNAQVFVGLHYWAIYGAGEHPGPGDHMSSLTEALESHASGDFKLTIGSDQVPSGGGGQPPPEANKEETP